MSKPEEGSSPNPLADRLMENRTVVLEGKIDAKSISEVGRRLLTLQARSADRVNLIIDSGGGSTYHALRLCDIMSHVMTAPVRGIAIGACHSAATFIMLHCHERLCTPHAKFVIHSGTMSEIAISMNDTTAKNLEDLLAEGKATTELVIKLYMSKLGRSREEVMGYIGRGDQEFNGAMLAEEAVSIGLVQKIVDGRLDIFPAPTAE